MITMGMEGRKWQIFNVAVDAFADKGYARVSIRDIASLAGIRSSSIYNHFPSKEAILDTIFDYDKFAFDTLLPVFRSALEDAENVAIHPLTGLYKIHCHPDLQTRMLRNKIMALAIHEIHAMPRAEELLLRNTAGGTKVYSTAILNKLIKLGRIEPLDVNVFSHLHANHIMASAIRGNSSAPISTEEWKQGLDMLFSLIKLKGEIQGDLPTGYFFYADQGWV